MTSTQHSPMTPASCADPGLRSGLGEEVDRQRERLLALRAQLVREREQAISPAVERTLEMAEVYLFLGLGYVGYTDELLPDTGVSGSSDA